MSTKQYKQAGEDVWKNRTEKINAELFTLTYGALVIQLIKDYEDYAEVNKQLDKMGYNIGARLIEDFLARTNLSKCSDFREVGEVVSKVGFKMFLNITPNVIHIQQEDVSSSAASAATAQQPTVTSVQGTGLVTSGSREFSLILDENPLAEFVELPRDARTGGLWFSNVLVGVLRGALEMVQMQTECFFVSDSLRGDETTELRVRLIKHLNEEAPIADD
ncbi:probable BET3 - involved in targeting and fusion of ER to golgi transport vesicles [Melanopsichium pennsylvanicum]|uniref:Probable BET3 - involved in targeting and fusion of ER to golgi transport vesicles n=2 Tax=Melanopsichium pennsylvanicum TaxID=63383 RepID=A0AAJ4XII9_9BASI|nr:probable BET3-involved in targeting and fusion of ER to golgi transport vesicles [Melanopsichium pennsylvanicum 4]SNX82677.1 probable BET3 - involved in targeting and fusion of ER to golgi transport vesicles [Melanopsichium pennsylvanicum]